MQSLEYYDYYLAKTWTVISSSWFQFTSQNMFPLYIQASRSTQDFNAIYAAPKNLTEDSNVPLLVDIHGGPEKLATTGVNFINVLWAAFTHTNPKSAKKIVKLSIFFALLGSARSKAVCRTLMKWNPGFQHRAVTFVELGYAVLMINYRGSVGNGDAILQSLLGNIAKVMKREIVIWRVYISTFWCIQFQF